MKRIIESGISPKLCEISNYGRLIENGLLFKCLGSAFIGFLL